MEIRTPSGTRDLTGRDVRKKRLLQKLMMDSFEKHGFEEVMTPAMEYYQTYSMAFDSLQDRQMVKLFDENSDILALRLDMTVPIARLYGAKYQDAKLPLRFCYASNVYKIRKNFAGKRLEVMDCGVELIGEGRIGDLEVLVTALDTLSSLPIGNYAFEIGEASFFGRAASLVFEDPKTIEALGDLINRKSLVELDEFLSRQNLNEKEILFFRRLPWLNGGAEVLEEARKVCFDESLQEVISSLKELYEDLRSLGYEEEVRFDLGKTPYQNYYTGLIFEAFADGVGTSILSGGRYDNLLEKFGRPADARGFSVKLDYLIDLFELPEKKETCILYYPEGRWQQAFSEARELRKIMPVVLTPWDQDEIVKEVVE